ncbi:MAG: hypothetical protein RI995_1587 [Bacteroidota bacterium]
MSLFYVKNVLNGLPLLIAFNKLVRMKRFIFAIVLSFSCVSLFGQVFSGLDEIEKAKKEGFFTYINSEEKFVTESWKKYLKKFGSVEPGRGGAINIYQAKISDISSSPLTLLSKISEEKNKTKLFVSISTGPDNYIQNGHEKYRDASNWLEDFVKIINLEEDVRTQEKALNDLIATKAKNQKAADRMVRELDSNRRQTELLTKKLEEAKIEKEKILANQEQNKLDQKANEEAILKQAQKFEEAKKKIN